MSATKLLVLGIVHLSGGAHGYQVRSELQSWRAEIWAKIKPGSVSDLPIVFYDLMPTFCDLVEHPAPPERGVDVAVAGRAPLEVGVLRVRDRRRTQEPEAGRALQPRPPARELVSGSARRGSQGLDTRAAPAGARTGARRDAPARGDPEVRDAARDPAGDAAHGRASTSCRRSSNSCNTRTLARIWKSAAFGWAPPIVRSAMSAATPERGGKRRRLFEVTPAGLRLLRDARRARTERARAQAEERRKAVTTAGR